MHNISVYPIGSKISVGELTGTITQIKLRGAEYAVGYSVSFITDDGHYVEHELYDIEFTSKAEKMTFLFSISSKVPPKNSEDSTK